MPPPKSAAACLLVSSVLVAYAIFSATSELIVAVYHEMATLSLYLGLGGGGDGDRKWVIARHPW